MKQNLKHWYWMNDWRYGSPLLVSIHCFITRKWEYCVCHRDTNPGNPVTRRRTVGHPPVRIRNATKGKKIITPWLTRIPMPHTTCR